jgi:hypothetical protein
MCRVSLIRAENGVISRTDSVGKAAKQDLLSMSSCVYANSS